MKLGRWGKGPDGYARSIHLDYASEWCFNLSQIQWCFQNRTLEKQIQFMHEGRTIKIHFIIISQQYNTRIQLMKHTKHLVKDGVGKRTETRQRWKNVTRLPDIWKNTQLTLGNLLTFFHLCLVTVLFSAPSLTEMKF